MDKNIYTDRKDPARGGETVMNREPACMIMAAMAAVTCTLMLASCGGGSGTADAPPRELQLLSYMDRETGDALQVMVDGFNASRKDIRVVVERVPLGNLKQKLQVAMKAGELPDLTIVDNPDNASMARDGYFEDITELAKDMEKDYFPGPWKSTFYNGRQYGMPLSSNCLALFYNKKILAEQGVAVPDTWDELRSAARKLTGPGRFGMAISAVATEEGTFQFIPWLLSAGGSPDRLDSPGAAKALGYLRTLITDGSMNRDVIEWTQGFLEKQFATGSTAMMINGPWNIDTIRKDAPDLDFGVARIPRDQEYASVLGGENIGICKGADREAAWAFLSWISRPEIMDPFITASGYFPPRKDVAAGNKRWNSEEVLRAIGDQMLYAMPRGPHPDWPVVSAIISRALQDGLLGLESPEVLMTRAAGDVRKATGQ